ncbi:hypothetical protein [Lactococcus lactis]|uniref:hypothetical protein n=1 Tax=Lactococcus lactis TaxID=1358 RepID=UPI000640154B|nr:hypothetical protein [Lactococcus lactis]KLK96205.1 hypothetical protein VN91_1556 [Lactococcus lactis subsp. lactis]MCT1172132.1 hypothetical protein [Lactococcus lactis]
MFQEIYTKDNEENFYVGKKLGRKENFYLYELIDDKGRFLSISLIHKNIINKTIDSSEYLDLMSSFVKTNDKFFDVFNLSRDFEAKKFNFSHLLNKYILYARGKKDLIEISKVVKVKEESLFLGKIDSPLYDSIGEELSEVLFSDFEKVDIVSVEEYLMRQYLKKM